MAIVLANGTNGLFDLLGKVFHIGNTLNTARLTTVPDEVVDAMDAYKLKTDSTLDMDAALGNILAAGNNAWASAGSNLMTPVRTWSEQLLIEVVNEDVLLPSRDLTSALKELIRQMAATHYVDANTIGLSLAADAGNSSTDLVIVTTDLRGDGREVENAFAEDIQFEVTAVSGGSATLTVKGEQRENDSLSHKWPRGSGINGSLTTVAASSSLVDNGDFQDEDTNTTDLPDKWLVNVGTIGTDIVLAGDPEVQTITIASDPTTGSYLLKWENPDGVVRSTAPIAWNATAAAVQSALRLIPGLELLTVTASGTSPNFTHTVTFTGVAGNINELTAVNHLDTGTITPATTTAGDDNAYIGQSLGIIGDGATATEICSPPMTLTAEKVYVCHFFHKKSGTPAAGTIQVAIVDEIGGAVTTDPEGNSNSATYDLTGGTPTTSFATGSFSFRLQKTQTMPVYLEIKQTVAISAGTDYYIDELSIVEAKELYVGGPFAAAFDGKTPPVLGDLWTLTVTNDRAGELQTFFDRVFDMRGKGLLLQSSDPGGGTLIADSVIG